MRTIKFRGKSIETGEWLYGDLWRRQQNGQGTIYTFITHTGGRIERVDPDTVGQFTGLSDKNKEEIYEGDILKGTGIDGKIGIWEAVSLQYFHHWEETEDIIERNNDIEIIGNIHENENLLY